MKTCCRGTPQHVLLPVLPLLQSPFPDTSRSLCLCRCVQSSACGLARGSRLQLWIHQTKRRKSHWINQHRRVRPMEQFLVSSTHVSFLKLVGVVFAVDQLPLSSVPLLSNQIKENWCIRPTSTNVPRTYGHSVFNHCTPQRQYWELFAMLFTFHPYTVRVTECAWMYGAAAHRWGLQWQEALAQLHCHPH